MVFPWVVAREVGGGHICHCLGVYADDLGLSSVSRGKCCTHVAHRPSSFAPPQVRLAWAPYGRAIACALYRKLSLREAALWGLNFNVRAREKLLISRTPIRARQNRVHHCPPFSVAPLHCTKPRHHNLLPPGLQIRQSINRHATGHNGIHLQSPCRTLRQTTLSPPRHRSSFSSSTPHPDRHDHSPTPLCRACRDTGDHSCPHR